MKITVGQLRKVIKEEIECIQLDMMLRESNAGTLQEGWADPLKKWVVGLGLAAAVGGGGKMMIDADNAQVAQISAGKAEADELKSWVDKLCKKAEFDKNAAKLVKDLVSKSHVFQSSDTKTLDKLYDGKTDAELIKSALSNHNFAVGIQQLRQADIQSSMR